MLGIEVSRVPTSDVTPSAGVTSNSTRFLSRVHLCLLVPVAHSSSECPGSSRPDADLVNLDVKIMTIVALKAGVTLKIEPFLNCVSAHFTKYIC